MDPEHRQGLRWPRWPPRGVAVTPEVRPKRGIYSLASWPRKLMDNGKSINPWTSMKIHEHQWTSECLSNHDYIIMYVLMPLDSIKQQDAEFIELTQTWGNQMDSPRKTGDKKLAILVRFHGDWIGLHHHKMVAWSAQGQDRAECGHAISSSLLQTLLAITTATYPVFDVCGVPPPTLHQEYGYQDVLCRAWFPAVYLQCVAQSYRWILSCVYRPKTTCACIYITDCST